VEATTTYRRVLGVDFGSQRVGLSLSDPLGIIAQPIEALKNNSSLFTHLQQLSTRENIKLIVVGMPFNLKGQQAQKANEVQKFIELLKAKLDIEVVVWDERFTTTIAHQTMLAMGTKKKERQKKDGRIDSMAAAIILQGFLDNMKHSHSC
jgi:putative Holliday junction resolvase